MIFHTTNSIRDKMRSKKTIPASCRMNFAMLKSDDCWEDKRNIALDKCLIYSITIQSYTEHDEITRIRVAEDSELHGYLCGYRKYIAQLYPIRTCMDDDPVLPKSNHACEKGAWLPKAITLSHLHRMDRLLSPTENKIDRSMIPYQSCSVLIWSQ